MTRTQNHLKVCVRRGLKDHPVPHCHGQGHPLLEGAVDATAREPTTLVNTARQYRTVRRNINSHSESENCALAEKGGCIYSYFHIQCVRHLGQDVILCLVDPNYF